MPDTSFLDWPFLNDAHRSLAHELDGWAQATLPTLIDEAATVDTTCRALVKKLGADGWLRYCVPADVGGTHTSLDVRSLCLIRETLARHAGIADFSFAMQGLGSGPISLFGTDEQKSAWLPAVMRGEAIAAFALSEPDAGSDVAAIATTATRQDNSYVLNGEKTWISNGGIADFYVVFARTGKAPGARGLSALLIPADTPGLTIAERIDVIAPHPLARLRFEDCRVPASALIGEAGAGFKVAMATLDVFRTTVGAAALGLARRAFDEAVTHAASRQIFGGALADLQLVQAKIADMALAIDASALLIYRAAWAKDQGAPRITREASMAKLHATEAAQRVIDDAVQLFGGRGVASGEIAEQLYREVRALRIYEGASDVQKLVIARAALAADDG